MKLQLAKGYATTEPLSHQCASHKEQTIPHWTLETDFMRVMPDVTVFEFVLMAAGAIILFLATMKKKKPLQ